MIPSTRPLFNRYVIRFIPRDASLDNLGPPTDRTSIRRAVSTWSGGWNRSTRPRLRSVSVVDIHLPHFHLGLVLWLGRTQPGLGRACRLRGAPNNGNQRRYAEVFVRPVGWSGGRMLLREPEMAAKKTGAKAPPLPESLRLKIVYRRIDELAPYKGNARTHSAKQITQIAASIRQFGFTNPVLIGGGGEIVAGHGRVAAAKAAWHPRGSDDRTRLSLGGRAPGLCDRRQPAGRAGRLGSRDPGDRVPGAGRARPRFRSGDHRLRDRRARLPARRS